MKLFKAALILGILLVLASNAIAQTDWAVASALALQDVSSENLIYECPLCVKEETIGSNLGAAVYACNKNEENCELTVSEKNGDIARKIGTLKFSSAKAYFVSKKLFYLQAAKANKNGLSYDINGIMIPYVSSGDKIDFVSASPGSSISSHPPSANELVINENYFNNFYYDVGDYNQVGEQLLRNPYQVESEMDTKSGYNLKRGYWRPISLCGHEYFDAITTLQSLNVNGRNLDARRWSWFLVTTDRNNPTGCVVKHYQLSTNEDPIYKNNIPEYSRQYSCGDSVYIVNSAAVTNLECLADTGEIVRNEPGDLLRCPVRPGIEKMACQKNSAVLMPIGATIYNIRYDSIYSDVDDTTPSEQDVPQKLILKTRVEDNIDNIGGQLISVKGRDSLVFVTALPSPCEESEQGCYSMEIVSGKKAGLPSNDVSFVEFGEAEGLIEIYDAEGRTLQRRYVLHNPDKTGRYRLEFNNNELLEISNLNKASSGTRVEGHVIKGIRMVSHLATLRGSPSSRLSFNEHIDLYPLQEGQDEASVNRPYLTYTVRQGGERLYDIAARFNGISTIQGLQSNPGTIGVPGNSENSAINDLIAEYAREIKLFNKRRNHGEWSQSETLNPALFGGEEVFIPLSAMSYLHPSQGNRVTVYSNPAESYQSITQRQRVGAAEVFHDIGSLDTVLNGAPENTEYSELQEWDRFLRVTIGNALSNEPNEQGANVRSETESSETSSLGQRGATEGEVMEIGQLPTGQAITGMQTIMETRGRVGCTNNIDCMNRENPKCVDGQCNKCVTDADCSHLSGSDALNKVCNNFANRYIDDGYCVRCTDHFEITYPEYLDGSFMPYNNYVEFTNPISKEVEIMRPHCAGNLYVEPSCGTNGIGIWEDPVECHGGTASEGYSAYSRCRTVRLSNQECVGDLRMLYQTRPQCRSAQTSEMTVGGCFSKYTRARLEASQEKGEGDAKRLTPTERRTDAALASLEPNEELITSLSSIGCNNHNVCKQRQRGAYCDGKVCRPSQWNPNPLYGLESE